MHDDFQHTLFLLSHRYLINKYRRHVLPMGKELGWSISQSRSRSQVHESCGLPKQEAALHTAVLSSRGVCTRELISLQARSNNHHLLFGGTRLPGKEGWRAEFVE